MKLVGLVTSIVLSASVVGAGVFLVRARGERAEAAPLEAPSEEGGIPAPGAGSRSARLLAEGMRSPRFVVQPNAKALGDHDPQARMDRSAEEEGQAQEQRFAEERQRTRERLAKDLGLTREQDEKLQQVLAGAQTTMRSIGQKIQAGQMQPQEIGAAFAAIREQQRQEMRRLLGEAGMHKLQEMRGQDVEIARLTGFLGASPVAPGGGVGAQAVRGPGAGGGPRLGLAGRYVVAISSCSALNGRCPSAAQRSTAPRAAPPTRAPRP